MEDLTYVETFLMFVCGLWTSYININDFYRIAIELGLVFIFMIVILWKIKIE